MVELCSVSWLHLMIPSGHAACPVERNRTTPGKGRDTGDIIAEEAKGVGAREYRLGPRGISAICTDEHRLGDTDFACREHAVAASAINMTLNLSIDTSSNFRRLD